MNLFGSYRGLLRNSKSAMLAAVEIYNKPTISYRDECFVILLVNAWELLLKAMLSRQRRRIFCPKQRGRPYEALSLFDSLRAASDLFPSTIPHQAVGRNLDLLVTYRNNCVHFYNKPGFGTVIHALAQTSVLNYRDLLEAFFGIRLEREITFVLLPLGMGAQLDPIEYIARTGASTRRDRAVTDFLVSVREAVQALESAGVGTERLLTAYSVSLQSVRRVSQADVVVGVGSGAVATEQVVVERRFDPNDPNWVRQKDIVSQVHDLQGILFTPFVFQALVWTHNIRSNPRYSWHAREGVLTKYSNEVIAVFRHLSRQQVEQALAGYRRHLRERRRAAARETGAEEV